jgi:hypothetical protein
VWSNILNLAMAGAATVMLQAPGSHPSMDSDAGAASPVSMTVHTLCRRRFDIPLPTPNVSLQQLREAIHAQLRVPIDAVRISVEGRQLDEDALVQVRRDTSLAMVSAFFTSTDPTHPPVVCKWRRGKPLRPVECR